MRGLLMMAALLALAGCGDKETPVVKAPEGGVASADMGGPLEVAYKCADGAHVRVAFGLDGAGVPNVVTDARGKRATLGKVADSPTLPGTRYTAENAWSADKLAILVARGQSLVLAESPLDDARGGEVTTLTTCEVTAPKTAN